MQLFGHRSKEETFLAWQFEAKGLLWHVRPTDAGVIVGEERLTEKKEATFFCLRRETGEVLWSDAHFGDPWWTGIAGVHRDLLFLHGFVSPDMPQHRGITAIDLFTGEVRWNRADLTFIGAAGNEVIVQESHPTAVSVAVLDRLTGEKLPFNQDIKSVTDEANVLLQSLEYPQLMETLLEESPSIGLQIRSQVGGESTIGPVSILVRGKKVAMSRHIRANTGLRANAFDHLLSIFDGTRSKPSFSMILDKNVKAFVPDPFFAHHDLLFCIRERRTLVAVPFSLSAVQ